MPTKPGSSIFSACLLLALFHFVVPVIGNAQEPARLTVDEIVGRMIAMDAQRAAKNQGYHGVRHYTVDYKGFPGDKHAEMVVNVVATQNHKEFTTVSQSGSQFLLNRVVRKLLDSESEAADSKNRREVKLTPENYDFSLLGTENVQNRRCYVLEVKPKRDNKFLYKGKVWIDAEEFAVMQISAKPSKNPSFWISSVEIEHQYEKVGDLWLPRSNQSTSKVKLGGHALLTIDYQKYELTDSKTVAEAIQNQ